MRQLDPKVTKKRQLSTFIYTWVNPPEGISSQHQAIQELAKLGFHTNETGRKLASLEESLTISMNTPKARQPGLRD